VLRRIAATAESAVEGLWFLVQYNDIGDYRLFLSDRATV
jgi:hypothetical protein